MSTSFPAVHHSYFIKKDGFGKLVADASWLIVQDGKIMSMDIMIAVIPRRLCQRGSEIPTFRAHTRQKQCHPSLIVTQPFPSLSRSYRGFASTRASVILVRCHFRGGGNSAPHNYSWIPD